MHTTAKITISTLILGAIATAPRSLVAQNGPEIVEEVLARESVRLADVRDYTVTQEVNGTRATSHFEKRTVDGRPTFVPISSFTLVQEALDRHRAEILQAIALINFEGASIEPEVASASYGQLSGFLRAAGDIGPSVLGGGLGQAATAVGAAVSEDGPPLGAVRDILVRSATRAGLQGLAGAVGGAKGDQLSQLAGALAGLGDQSILGQIGKIGVGQLKSLALEKVAQALGGPLVGAATDMLGGGGVGGLADLLGDAGGPGSAMAPQAAGGLAQAGLGALMGGVGMLAVDAMIPDLDALDAPMGRSVGPDIRELLRAVGPHVRVTGSDEVDGHDLWVLTLTDLSALRLPDAKDFEPTGVTLHIDKSRYVVRQASVSGDLTMDGQTTPISMDTRLEDYREVGGLLYPFRTVTLIQGLQATITDEDRRAVEEMGPKMDEVRKQMQKQLEEAPPEQRAMIERMMQQRMPQMEQMMAQMEAMASEEPTPITASVIALRVNEGRPEALRALELKLRPPSGRE